MPLPIDPRIQHATSARVVLHHYTPTRIAFFANGTRHVVNIAPPRTLRHTLTRFWPEDAFRLAGIFPDQRFWRAKAPKNIFRFSPRPEDSFVHGNRIGVYVKNRTVSISNDGHVLRWPGNFSDTQPPDDKLLLNGPGGTTSPEQVVAYVEWLFCSVFRGISLNREASAAPGVVLLAIA